MMVSCIGATSGPADGAGAEGYREHTIAGSGGPGIEQFTPELPEADIGYRGVRAGFGFVVLIAAEGPYLVQVVANGDTATTTVEDFLARAEAVLASQLQTLG